MTRTVLPTVLADCALVAADPAPLASLRAEVRRAEDDERAGQISPAISWRARSIRIGTPVSIAPWNGLSVVPARKRL